MTTAVAVELGPLVRAAAPSTSSPRILPPRRRRAAVAIRASPVSGRSEGAGEPPAPLLPNARRRAREPLWHGGGFSLGVDLGDARTGLAVGRGITLPRPLTVRTTSLSLQLLRVKSPTKLRWAGMVPGSEAARAEAGADAARRGPAAGAVVFSCLLLFDLLKL